MPSRHVPVAVRPDGGRQRRGRSGHQEPYRQNQRHRWGAAQIQSSRSKDYFQF